MLLKLTTNRYNNSQNASLIAKHGISNICLSCVSRVVRLPVIHMCLPVTHVFIKHSSYLEVIP